MSHSNHSYIHLVPRVIIFLLLAMAMSHAADSDFPEAPPRLQDAEAKGLHRLSNDELKTFFPGTIALQRHRGSQATKTFKPDGSVEVKGGLKDFTGTWRFDEKRNAYCDRMYKKKKQEERCYAVFSAGDGTHYFDYDIGDKLQTLIWRRAGDK